MPISENIPRQFVWTRYGTEAGENADRILARKETERRGADGVFLWGIGNSVTKGISLLVRKLEGRHPVVVFSPMISAARAIDAKPAHVARWLGAMRIDGSRWPMPNSAVVTSRISDIERPRRRFALVCFSEEVISANSAAPRFDIADLVNLESRAPVGASQVTAVVENIGGDRNCGPYVRAFTARLVPPYVVALCDPNLSGLSREAPSAQLGLL
jgi:hypothetical protein